MRLSCDPNEILWYAMSSPFRREMKAKALLDAHHIENFIPMKKRQEIRDGEIVTWESRLSTTLSSCMTATMAS